MVGSEAYKWIKEGVRRGGGEGSRGEGGGEGEKGRRGEEREGEGMEKSFEWRERGRGVRGWGKRRDQGERREE